MDKAFPIPLFSSFRGGSPHTFLCVCEGALVRGRAGMRGDGQRCKREGGVAVNESAPGSPVLVCVYPEGWFMKRGEEMASEE